MFSRSASLNARKDEEALEGMLESECRLTAKTRACVCCVLRVHARTSGACIGTFQQSSFCTRQAFNIQRSSGLCLVSLQLVN